MVSIRASCWPWRALGIAKADNELPDRRRQGVERYRDLSRDVTVLSRLQLDGEVLERLGQKSASVSTPGRGARLRVLTPAATYSKTPHIALLALDIMDALGVTYQVMGGPSHCCGIMQLRAGRHRNVRAHGLEHDREAVALQVRAGHLLVPELLRPVHRD